MGKPLPKILPALLAAFILAGCGGGGGDSGNTASTSAATLQSQTAADGLARFNYWRGQLGLHALVRNAQLDVAAQGHSDYQAYNEIITHYQTVGAPHFTGVCLTDDASDPKCDPSHTSRLEQAKYVLPADNYAVGEVISETAGTAGSDAADALIAAIYHRFVIFEPMFKEAGAGAATSAGGATYFTTDVSAIGLDSGLGFGHVVTFPMSGQKDIPVSFSSDSEIPDPVPSQNVVGYPVSVHADIIYTLTVNSFTIAPHGGAPLAVQQLWSSVDSNTGESEAAIVPLSPLQSATTYDVQFSGTMVLKDQNNVVTNSTPVNVSWSFTTK